MQTIEAKAVEQLGQSNAKVQAELDALILVCHGFVKQNDKLPCCSDAARCKSERVIINQSRGDTATDRREAQIFLPTCELESSLTLRCTENSGQGRRDSENE
jgi:hypothetical protein